MLTKSTYIFLAAIFAIISCEKHKRFSADEKQNMAELLTQLYVFQGHENGLNRNTVDSLAIIRIENDSLFEMYNTTQANFKKSMNALREHPDDFVEVYENVNVYLDSLQSYIKAQPKSRYTLPLDKNLIASFRSDSIVSEPSSSE